MQAIVLSRRDFREYDQIISLYTKESGKQEVLARGIKKITSKNSASLEPFCLIDCEIINGKEIDHITKTEILSYYTGIRTDLKKSLMAGYVARLVDKITEVNLREPGLFNLIKNWLEFLEETKNSDYYLIDMFVFKFIKILGFGLEETKNKIKHEKIFQQLQYHTEKDIVDWSKLAKLA